MVTYHISRDCVVLLLAPGPRPDWDTLRQAVQALLLSAGFPAWSDMEAELFCLEGRLLLIARPRSPRLRRLAEPFPRLRRN